LNSFKINNKDLEDILEWDHDTLYTKCVSEGNKEFYEFQDWISKQVYKKRFKAAYQRNKKEVQLEIKNQITQIGSINIQELEAKMVLDEEEIRSSFIGNSPEIKHLTPKSYTNWVASLKIEDLDDFDSDQESDKDR